MLLIDSQWPMIDLTSYNYFWVSQQSFLGKRQYFVLEYVMATVAENITSTSLQISSKSSDETIKLVGESSKSCQNKSIEEDKYQMYVCLVDFLYFFVEISISKQCIHDQKST